MSQLTVEERRRAAERRRHAATQRARAITVEELGSRPESRALGTWAAALLVIGTGALAVLGQLLGTLADHTGAAALLDWLLPRL